MKLKPMSCVKLFILLLLFRSSMNGYEIVKSLNHIFGKVNTNQVYPLLKQMEKAGILESRIEYHGKRKRIFYSLTQEGRKLTKEYILTLFDIISEAVE
ncbi:MAG: PadR family transcriptional regulator [Candidatus Aenigmarchaeota archaeon]|nr:PadR family transcriptional regulator [Candidatus Aenigmarchaeota archaeon]